jgi:hypothetical protein
VRRGGRRGRDGSRTDVLPACLRVLWSVRDIAAVPTQETIMQFPTKHTLAIACALSTLAACGGGDPAAPATAGATVPAPSSLSGNVTCVNFTIGAIHLDSVFVPDGASCTLLGTSMIGSVEVGSASRLIAENVNINGNLKADGAADVRVSGASRSGGSVQLARGAGAFIIGMRVTGDMQIDAMTGPVTAADNRINGNLQAVGNRGGLTLEANTMGGNLQCKENDPAPAGGGNVATLKEDQCQAL